MGNDHARGKHYLRAANYGQLYIQIEKPSYNAGETITGNIYVDLNQATSSSQLFLKLKGKETFHIVERNNKIEKYTVKVLDLIKTKVALCEPECFQQGQFVYPFTLLLPELLPGTFFQQSSKYLAHIAYYLEASIKPATGDEPIIKFKQPFVLLQSPKFDLPQSTAEVQTQIPSCCFSKGSNVLKITSQKSSYLPGEIVQIALEFDNSKCTIDNTAITVDLKQRLTLGTGKTEFTQVITKVHREVPGVPARRVSDNLVISMNLPPFQEEDYWEIKKIENMAEYIKKQQDTEKITSTTKSRLISSEYFIEVHCTMNGSCTVHPELVLPIELQFQQYPDPKLSTPPNWNPMIRNNINIVMDARGSNSVSVNTIQQNHSGSQLMSNGNRMIEASVSSEISGSQGRTLQSNLL